MRNFSLRIFLLILVLVTAVLGSGIWLNYQLYQQAIRDTVAQRDERVAQAAALTIANAIRSRQQTIDQLAIVTQEGLLDTAQLEKAHPQFNYGFLYFHPEKESINISNNTQLWEAIQSVAWPTAAEKRIWPLRIDDETVILVSSMMNDGSFLIGAFSASLLVEQAISEVFNPSDDALLFVVDEHGTPLFVVGEQLHNEISLSHPGVQEALAGRSGTTYIDPSYLELEHIVAYSPVQEVGWALVVEEAWQAVANPWLEITPLVPLILLVPLAVALFMLWLVNRRIIRPLQFLARQATAFGQGEATELKHRRGAIGAIQELQEELDLMLAQIEASKSGLKRYLEAVNQGQEEERSRLARELHDGTLQTLIALDQQVKMALKRIPAAEQGHNLQRAEELLQESIIDLRRITRALRPSILEDLGLIPALEMLVRDVSQNYDLPVPLVVEGKVRVLPPPIPLTLYRIVQEALSNIGRHAAASSAYVRLTFEPHLVQLTISDDGCGFTTNVSPSTFAVHGHFGLLGMVERAELIGAELTFDSELGEGTQVRLTLPLR